MKKIIRTTAGATDRVGPILGAVFALIGIIMASAALTPGASTTQPVLKKTRDGAVPAVRLAGPRAAEIFNLAKVRAAATAHSAAQRETPNEATLTTDREDYSPYSYVHITGAGFGPGETVNMIVVELSPTPGAFEPWNVVADENGNFQTS